MKKTLLLLLAAILVIVPVITCTSCSKDEVDEKTNLTDEMEDDAFSPNIPAGTKFDGETFNFLIGSVGYLMYAEEETGDLLNDAVYRRNTLIAEHFGIDLNIEKRGFNESEGQGEATALFRSLIESGDETYNAFSQVQHSGMPQMMLENYFVDWNTIPYINLEDNWWHQKISDELSFGDKIYVMTGDYSIYLERTNCLVFNKDIFDELGLEYPYQDVLDGTWTFDKFSELVKQGADDLNGDGLMTKEDDQWGFVGWTHEQTYALLASSGFTPLKRDADNLPVLNEDVETNHEIYGRIVDMFADGQSALAVMDDYASNIKVFTEGRAMFKDIFLGMITTYTDVEFDFGIIPYPKWDEDSEYMSRSANMTPLTYIPVTNPNLELTGAVLEEMAYQSAKTVTPVYFDIVLTVKNTRDVESEAMLPIIRDSSRFMYEGFTPSIVMTVHGGTNNYASSYAANLSKYQEDLEEMREYLTREE